MFLNLELTCRFADLVHHCFLSKKFKFRTAGLLPGQGQNVHCVHLPVSDSGINGVRYYTTTSVKYVQYCCSHTGGTALALYSVQYTALIRYTCHTSQRYTSVRPWTTRKRPFSRAFSTVWPKTHLKSRAHTTSYMYNCTYMSLEQVQCPTDVSGLRIPET